MAGKIFKFDIGEYQVNEVRLTKGTPFPQNESKELKDLWAKCADPNNWELYVRNTGLEGWPKIPNHHSEEAPFGGVNVGHMVWRINVTGGEISHERLTFTRREFEMHNPNVQPVGIVVKATAIVEPVPPTAPLKVVTKPDFAAALKMVQEWVPEERESIETHMADILSYVEAKKEVQPGNPIIGAEVETHQWKDGTVTHHLPIQQDNPLRLVQYASLQQEPTSQHPDASCAGSVVSVTASSMWFLMGLIGFRGAAPASLKPAMLKAAMKNPEAVSGLMKIATKLRETDSALERAAQVFLIVKGAVEFGPATLVRVLRHELSWYEWVFFVTMLVAQYFAWVLSDGLALIAQIALTILNASQLSIDISKCHQACTQPA